MVETILLDDIIEYLPRSEKAIMKIDIESLEPYVIPTAINLFSILRIQIILMEFNRMMFKQTNKINKVKQLVDFLLERDFVPYSYYNKKLVLDKWINWPGDICWVQKNLTLDHEYNFKKVL